MSCSGDFFAHTTDEPIHLGGFDAAAPGNADSTSFHFNNAYVAPASHDVSWVISADSTTPMFNGDAAGIVPTIGAFPWPYM